MMKRTASRPDIARMHKLAEQGEPLSNISKLMQIEEDMCRHFLAGATVRVSADENVKTEVVTDPFAKPEKKTRKKKAAEPDPPAASPEIPSFTE